MFLIVNLFINLLCARFDCTYYYPPPTASPALILKSNLSLLASVRAEPVVFTSNGALEGYFMEIVDGKKIYAFEGIPYAESPTENKRFKDPSPKTPWYSMRKAQSPGPDCLQLSILRYLQVVGREDCLYLNLYSPEIHNLESRKKFPVIIFIHGGGFNCGSGRETGPSYLLQEDVILVTFNYRLGVLGFMSTGNEASLGNWGLKDQSMAIKWVHDNVEAFGGNKDRIMVMGQSAGGVAAHLHMLSTTNMARGLFSRGASLSGSAFHHWGLQSPDYAKYFTNRLGEILGCSSTTESDSQALVNCFRKVNPYFLVAAQRSLYVTSTFPFVHFGPVIEPDVPAAFITDKPENYYKKGLVMNVPFLCTNVESESAFLYLVMQQTGLVLYYTQYWKALIPFIFDYGRYVESSDNVTDVITKYYFGIDRVPKNGLRLDPNIVMEVGTDRYFSIANKKALRAHSVIAPTYSYLYKFRGESGMINYFHGDYKRYNATHSDDIASIFNSTFFFKPLQRNSLHFEVSKVMVNLLVNFAETGEPLYTNDENGQRVKVWDRIVSPEEIKFLEISKTGNFQMVDESLDRRLKLNLWESFGL